MSQQRLTWRTLGWPVYVALALLIVFAVFFLIELFTVDTDNTNSIEPVSEQAYVERVNALLSDADPVNGEALLTTYGCIACHRAGAVNGIAPAFVGVGERADERRPPMPAASYLYESIIHPGVYIVEGYPNSMLQTFGERISDDELGDIIAYLLTPDAH